MNGTFMPSEPICDINKHRSADGNQYVRSQACGALSVLTFQTDQPSQNKRSG